MEDTNKEMRNFMRYSFGEHQKGKEITYDEGLMSKSVSLKWDYYDVSKKIIIVDKRTGEVVNSDTWW